MSRSLSEKWVKKIQAAAYNGARTVCIFRSLIFRPLETPQSLISLGKQTRRS